MPAFIHVTCPCGREVRAKKEQVGTAVRCWSCGREVRVPIIRAGGELVRVCADAVVDLTRAEWVLVLVGGAAAVVAALAVPGAGWWLGLAGLVVAAWLYQSEFARSVELVRGPVTGTEPNRDEVPSPGPPPWSRAARAALAVAGAAALVAPVLVRNGGHLLPGDRRGLGSFWWMLAVVPAWLVLPLVMALVNARDRLGPVPPLRAAGGLARHPVATLASVALFPASVAVLEALLVLLCLEQDYLPLMITDLFPKPELVHTPRLQYLTYDYDGLRLTSYLYAEIANPMTLYLAALSRGYTLVGSIPASLAAGVWEFRVDPEFFQRFHAGYVAVRLILSTLIFAWVGFFVAVQARWLGLIATIDTMFLSPRPAVETSASGNGAAAPSATPAPVPAPAAAVPAVAPAGSYGGVAGAPLGPGGSGVAASPFALPGLAAGATGPAPGPGESAAATALVPPPSAQTILIIDDERAFAHALSKILVGRGFAVYLAGDAAEGYQLAVVNRPDLIVLDLLLPDRPGIDLCRDLRAHPATRDTPIVVATYKTGADDEVAGLTQGADDYIAKPYVVEVLIARIQKQLARRRA